jgi:hypothetical protein
MQTTYMQRDEAEMRNVIANESDGQMKQQYCSMLMIERNSAIVAGAEPSWSLQTASAQEQLAGFLRSRGLPSHVRFHHLALQALH